MLWWLSVAPLGKPVVPLVYWMLIGSSNCVTGSSASAPAMQRLPLVRVQVHDLLERRQVAPHLVDHRRVVRALERPRGDERAAPRLREHVGELRRAVGGVDVDQHDAGLAPSRTGRAPTPRSSGSRCRAGRPARCRTRAARARAGRRPRPARRRCSGRPDAPRRAHRGRRPARSCGRDSRRSSRRAAGPPPRHAHRREAWPEPTAPGRPRAPVARGRRCSGGTGSAARRRAAGRESASSGPRRRAAPRACPGSRRRSSGCPCRTRGGGGRSPARGSNRSGSGNTAGSRPVAASQRNSLAPSGSATPPSVTGRCVTRRQTGTEVS